jgi:putative membrane protein
MLGVAALLILMAAWGTQGSDGTGSFAVHMIAHMGVVAVAAPLLAAALAGTRADPVYRFPVLFNAIVASAGELVIVWAWHTPAMHMAARHGTLALIAEQGSFLGAGLWMWLSILGGPVHARAERAAIGVVALLLTFAHMTLLGALLALSPRTLYHHAAGVSSQVVADQQMGGAIMLAVGSMCYVGAGVWLAVGLVTRSRHTVGGA